MDKTETATQGLQRVKNQLVDNTIYGYYDATKK